jgi:ABC-type antimicrobial peptide transport system permease subunit
MACFSTIITLVVHKYFLVQSETESEGQFKMMMKNYSKIVFRIGFAVLGSIIASIVVACRNGASPGLLSSNYSQTAGLEIVAFILTLVFGLIFGLITGVSINVFLGTKVNAEQANTGEVNQMN